MLLFGERQSRPCAFSNLSNHVVKRPGENVPSSSRFKIPLKLLLVVALLPFRRFYFQPNELAVDDANDVRASERAKTIEVFVRVNKRAGIVAVMKNPP
jgi:hypothetical protein